jgi:acetylornithine deacetylase/succinyl-diaminopimelate desuccinylase-like protein
LPISKLQTVLAAIDASETERLERLFGLLRIASVGTDPHHAGDCRTAAEWLMNTFRAKGFASGVHETTGQPVVMAHYVPPGNPHVPHVLFYGHYDVQPSDPDELWTTPPYQPVIRKAQNGDDAIFARGAADDKGQLMTFVEANFAWLAAHGSLPFRLTVLIEGDEEGDNSHLDRFILANKSRLAADAAFICDTNLWNRETPAIVTALRGTIGEEVVVQGPRIDLHSGYFGGPAVNPIKALSTIIASLHDKKGRVTIPGFYNGIKPLTPAQRRKLKALPFDEKTFMKNAGLKTAAGETGYSVLEQVWMRPTCEVNGMIGGYTAEGSKTVLPAHASAKFTFRLVKGQNAAAIRKSFRAHVKKHLAKDCKVTIESSGGNIGGVRVADDSIWIELGQKALTDEWGKNALLVGEGGSIPVVESFRQHLKMDSLLMGFGLDDDCVHSPNEKYDLRSFNKGTRTWARLIAAIEAENVRAG